MPDQPTRRAYVCAACHTLHDHEEHPPLRLRVVIAAPVVETDEAGNPRRQLPPEHDVFLCPAHGEEFRRDGKVALRLGERVLSLNGGGSFSPAR